MKEGMLYFDWYLDDRKYSLEYAGIEDDLAVMETENYIIYLTVVGDAVIKKDNLKYKDYEDFPFDLRDLISKNGIKDVYGSYKVIETCYFNYCLSKKVADEEEFLCCFSTFTEIGSKEEEKERMEKLIDSYVKTNLNDDSVSL